MRNVLDVTRVLILITPALFAASTTAAPATATVMAGNMDGPPRAPLGLTASLGMRSDLVRSPGLDAFSASDGIPQSALAVAARVAGRDGADVAAGFEWNHGTTAARARAGDASLVLDRLSLSVEGRVPVWGRLSASGRLAPGLLRNQARIVDPSVPGGAYGSSSSGVLQQTKWIPALDASAGLALRFAEARGRGTPTFVFWVTAEGGYGYVAAHQLVLGTGAEAQPGRVDEQLRLGSLALSGAFVRARFAVSF